MAYPVSPTKTFVLRARRETVALFVFATGATFALASAIHSHHPVRPAATSALQAWTGGLADVRAPALPTTDAAPVTSASFVVPKSQFALPDVRVHTLVRVHGCDGSLCTSRVAAAPAPPRRPTVALVDAAMPPAIRVEPRSKRPNLMARLNPLNHLPDASTLKHPFIVAGDAVTGWFRRF